jgi:hypothetical protein
MWSLLGAIYVRMVMMYQRALVMVMKTKEQWNDYGLLNLSFCLRNCVCFCHEYLRQPGGLCLQLLRLRVKRVLRSMFSYRPTVHQTFARTLCSKRRHVSTTLTSFHLQQRQYKIDTTQSRFTHRALLKNTHIPKKKKKTSPGTPKMSSSTPLIDPTLFDQLRLKIDQDTAIRKDLEKIIDDLTQHVAHTQGLLSRIHSTPRSKYNGVLLPMVEEGVRREVEGVKVLGEFAGKLSYYK